MEHVNFQELQTALSESRKTIIDHMNAGFSAVTARQDITNGRIEKAEARIGDHDVALSRIPIAGSEHAPITRREVALVLSTLGFVVAVLKGGPWFLGLLR